MNFLIYLTLLKGMFSGSHPTKGRPSFGFFNVFLFSICEVGSSILF